MSPTQALGAAFLPVTIEEDGSFRKFSEPAWLGGPGQLTKVPLKQRGRCRAELRDLFHGDTEARVRHTLADEENLILKVQLASWGGPDRFCRQIGLPGAVSSGSKRSFMQVLLRRTS